LKYTMIFRPLSDRVGWIDDWPWDLDLRFEALL
jgi:hypothetical protein